MNKFQTFLRMSYSRPYLYFTLSQAISCGGWMSKAVACLQHFLSRFLSSSHEHVEHQQDIEQQETGVAVI